MNASLTPSVLTAIARWALVAAGGWAANQGWITSDQATQLAGGAAVLAGLAWSIWQKFVANRNLKTAIMSPAQPVKP